MQKITPCLWFKNNIEEAMEFYTSVFKNSKFTIGQRYPEDMPGELAGKVLTTEFEIEGQKFIGLNGGQSEFNFTEAISFSISCQSQEEVDYYWSKLTADGGEESQCGWLKDKFGISWQVVPDRLMELMGDKDREKANKVIGAMMQMKKIDIPTLEQAYNS